MKSTHGYAALAVALLVAVGIGVRAADSVQPTQFPGGMNKMYFAEKYLSPNERQRVAAIMCSKESFLMQCTGALTEADDPAYNGRTLDASDCRAFFLTQFESALAHKGAVTGVFYNSLPVNLSDQQAASLRETLIQNIHGGAVSSLARQGAPVNRDEACAARLVQSLKEVRKN